MLGYPGAGKTTVATMLQELTGGVRFSSDELRVQLFSHPTFTESEHQELYKQLDGRLEAAMNAKTPVIIYDANVNRRIHREEKYKIARQYGYQAVLVWVQTPKELAKERRINDAHHHLVPAHENIETMFDRIAHIFETPEQDEKYITIDGRHATLDDVKNLLNASRSS